jgi:hypothetical protein
MIDELARRAGDQVTTILREALAKALAEGERRGYARGAAEVRTKIMAAVGSAAASAVGRAASSGLAGANGEDKEERAPRGAVREVVAQVLASQPGATITEAELAAASLNELVSRKSVGNEMRRGEGSLYRREGRQWYLAQEPGTDAAAAASRPGAIAAAVSTATGEASHGADLRQSA